MMKDRTRQAKSLVSLLGSIASIYLLVSLAFSVGIDRTSAQDFEDDEEAFAFDEDLEHNANDFLFRHEAFEVPLRIHIGLLGLSRRAGERGGNYNLNVDARELERLLVSDLIYHTSSVQEEGKEKQLNNINFYMRYNARHLSLETLKLYEQLLSKNLKRTDHYSEADPSYLTKASYEVEITGEIEAFFDNLHKTITLNNNLGDDNEYTVFIVNPRPENFLPLPPVDSREKPDDSWQKVREMLTKSKRWYSTWKARKGSEPPQIYNDDLSSTPYDFSHDGPRYRYTYAGGARTQSWIGRHRYVVIDLSAADTTYGPTASGDGIIISGSAVPDIRRFVSIAKEASAKSAQLLRSEMEKNPVNNEAQDQGKEDPTTVVNLSDYLSNMAELKASFLASIKSAIQHVFAADIRFADMPFSDKILIPIIVFHNHAQFDPYEPNRINMDDIQRAVKRFTFPGQEVVVVKGQHSLHDHKHISMALAKSLRTESTYEIKQSETDAHHFVPKRRTYVDSKTLMMELRDASDMLASGLLKTSQRQDLYRAFFNTDIPFIGYNQTRPKGLQGTRVLPVYIFSLGVGSTDMLLDKSSSLVAASSDMVVVLQVNNTETKVPYFSEDNQLIVNPEQSTRHIIAGLTMALGGVVEPTKSYSPIKKKVMPDYSWAHGCTPFGYFANSDCVSQIFVDSMIRNSVVSRANRAIEAVVQAIESVETFGEKWGFNWQNQRSEEGKRSWLEDLYHLPSAKTPLPKDTIHRLHGEIRHLERKFIEAADLLSRYELEKAYKISSSFGLISHRFKQYVEDDLEAAENRMRCCEMKHDIIESISLLSSLESTISYAALLVIVFFIWLIIFPNQKASRNFYQ